MNCMSVQQEKKSYHRSHQQQTISADKHSTSTSSSSSSRVGLRSCLRGGVEIEEAESKIRNGNFNAMQLTNGEGLEVTCGFFENLKNFSQVDLLF